MATRKNEYRGTGSSDYRKSQRAGPYDDESERSRWKEKYKGSEHSREPWLEQTSQQQWKYGDQSGKSWQQAKHPTSSQSWQKTAHEAKSSAVKGGNPNDYKRQSHDRHSHDESYSSSSMSSYNKKWQGWEQSGHTGSAKKTNCDHDWTDRPATFGPSSQGWTAGPATSGPSSEHRTHHGENKNQWASNRSDDMTDSNTTARPATSGPSTEQQSPPVEVRNHWPSVWSDNKTDSNATTRPATFGPATQYQTNPPNVGSNRSYTWTNDTWDDNRTPRPATSGPPSYSSGCHAPTKKYHDEEWHTHTWGSSSSSSNWNDHQAWSNRTRWNMKADEKENEEKWPQGHHQQWGNQSERGKSGGKKPTGEHDDTETEWKRKTTNEKEQDSWQRWKTTGWREKKQDAEQHQEAVHHKRASKGEEDTDNERKWKQMKTQGESECGETTWATNATTSAASKGHSSETSEATHSWDGRHKEQPSQDTKARPGEAENQRGQKRRTEESLEKGKGEGKSKTKTGKANARHRNNSAGSSERERDFEHDDRDADREIVVTSELIRCKKNHRLSNEAAAEGDQCQDCEGLIDLDQYKWTCAAQCLTICEQCAKTRMDTLDPGVAATTTWLQQAHTAMMTATEVPVSTRQQLAFEGRMLSNDPCIYLQACSKWDTCKVKVCPRLHKWTVVRVLAMKVKPRCGCLIPFPMNNLEGFNEEEKAAIQNQTCPVCQQALECPYDEIGRECPFGKNCWGLHGTRKRQRKMDACQLQQYSLVRKKYLQMMPKDYVNRGTTPMSEEEWQNIRELYTHEAEIANKIYNHYREEEMRKSRKGPRTTIQWEAKQSTKGKGRTPTEFQARRTDEILLQVQHDEEGFANEGEAQQEGPQEVPTSEWLIDLAEKNGANTLITAMMPPTIRAYEETSLQKRIETPTAEQLLGTQETTLEKVNRMLEHPKQQDGIVYGRGAEDSRKRMNTVQQIEDNTWQEIGVRIRVLPVAHSDVQELIQRISEVENAQELGYINGTTGRYWEKAGREWTQQYVIVADCVTGIKAYSARSFQSKRPFNWEDLPEGTRKGIEQIWHQWGKATDPRNVGHWNRGPPSDPTVKFVGTRDCLAIVVRAPNVHTANKMAQSIEDAIAIVMCPNLRAKIAREKVARVEWWDRHGKMMFTTCTPLYRFWVVLVIRAIYSRVDEYFHLFEKIISHPQNVDPTSASLVSIALRTDEETQHLRVIEQDLIPYQIRTVLGTKRMVENKSVSDKQTCEDASEQVENEGLNWRYGSQTQVEWQHHEIPWNERVPAGMSVPSRNMINLKRLGELYAPTTLFRMKIVSKGKGLHLAKKPKNERVGAATSRRRQIGNESPGKEEAATKANMDMWRYALTAVGPSLMKLTTGEGDPGRPVQVIAHKNRCHQDVFEQINIDLVNIRRQQKQQWLPDEERKRIMDPINLMAEDALRIVNITEKHRALTKDQEEEIIERLRRRTNELLKLAGEECIEDEMSAPAIQAMLAVEKSKATKEMSNVSTESAAESIDLVTVQAEGWGIRQETRLVNKVNMLRKLSLGTRHMVVTIIAFDGTIEHQDYWEVAREAQHDVDKALSERDGEATYVTVTVDEIVPMGLMHASECHPYNAVQVAMSLYETCGGNATIIMMDADLVVTQLTTINEVIEAAQRMHSDKNAETDTQILAGVYAEKYNTCNTGYVIFPRKRHPREVRQNHRAEAMTRYEARQGRWLQLQAELAMAWHAAYTHKNEMSLYELDQALYTLNAINEAIQTLVKITWLEYRKPVEGRGTKAALFEGDEGIPKGWNEVDIDIKGGATVGKIQHKIQIATTMDVLLDYNTWRIIATQAYFPKKEKNGKVCVDMTLFEDAIGARSRVQRPEVWGGQAYEQAFIEDMKFRTRKGTAIAILPGETIGMQQAGQSHNHSCPTHTQHAYGLNPNQMTKEQALRQAIKAAQAITNAEGRTFRRLMSRKQARTGCGSYQTPATSILSQTGAILTGTGTIAHTKGRRKHQLELQHMTMTSASTAPPRKKAKDDIVPGEIRQFLTASGQEKMQRIARTPEEEQKVGQTVTNEVENEHHLVAGGDQDNIQNKMALIELYMINAVKIRHRRQAKIKWQWKDFATEEDSRQWTKAMVIDKLIMKPTRGDNAPHTQTEWKHQEWRLNATGEDCYVGATSLTEVATNILQILMGQGTTLGAIKALQAVLPIDLRQPYVLWIEMLEIVCTPEEKHSDKNRPMTLKEKETYLNATATKVQTATPPHIIYGVAEAANADRVAQKYCEERILRQTPIHIESQLLEESREGQGPGLHAIKVHTQTEAAKNSKDILTDVVRQKGATNLTYKEKRERAIAEHWLAIKYLWMHQPGTTAVREEARQEKCEYQLRRPGLYHATKAQRRKETEEAKGAVQESVDNTHWTAATYAIVHIEYLGLGQEQSGETDYHQCEHVITKITKDKHKCLYGDTNLVAEEYQNRVAKEEARLMVMPASSPHQQASVILSRALPAQTQTHLQAAAAAAFTGDRDKDWRPGTLDEPTQHYPVAFAMPDPTAKEDMATVITALAKAYWHKQGRILTISIKGWSAGTPGAMAFFDVLNQWDEEINMAPKPAVVRLDMIGPLFNPDLFNGLSAYIENEARNEIPELEEHETTRRPTWRNTRPRNEEEEQSEGIVAGRAEADEVEIMNDEIGEVEETEDSNPEKPHLIKAMGREKIAQCQVSEEAWLAKPISGIIKRGGKAQQEASGLAAINIIGHYCKGMAKPICDRQEAAKQASRYVEARRIERKWHLAEHNVYNRRTGWMAAELMQYCLAKEGLDMREVTHEEFNQTLWQDPDRLAIVLERRDGTNATKRSEYSLMLHVSNNHRPEDEEFWKNASVQRRQQALTGVRESAGVYYDTQSARLYNIEIDRLIYMKRIVEKGYRLWTVKKQQETQTVPVDTHFVSSTEQSQDSPAPPPRAEGAPQVSCERMVWAEGMNPREYTRDTKVAMEIVILINQQDKLCPMNAIEVRKMMKAGAWLKLRTPAQVHQIVSADHQTNDMTAACGKNRHNYGRLEKSLFTTRGSVTVTDPWRSHNCWNHIQGECACLSCQTQSATLSRPADHATVKICEEQIGNTKFVEQMEHPLIHTAYTDIDVKDIRLHLEMSDKRFKVQATVYDYVNNLTKDKGLQATGMGMVATEWEKYWHQLIEYWKKYHVTILEKVLRNEPAEADNYLAEVVKNAMAEGDYTAEATDVQRFVQVNQQLIHDMRKAMPETTAINQLCLLMITIPESILEYPAKVAGAKKKLGNSTVDKAGRHTVLRYTTHSHRPEVQIFETDKIHETPKEAYFRVQIKFHKCVDSYAIAEQLNKLTGIWMPRGLIDSLYREGKKFIPECMLFTGTARHSKEMSVMRMSDNGRELTLQIGPTEEDDPEGTNKVTLSGLVLGTQKAELNIAQWKKDNQIYSRGAPSEVWLMTKDVEAMRRIRDMQTQGAVLYIHGLSASAIHIETAQMSNAMECSAEYLLLRHGTGTRRILLEDIQKAHHRSVLRSRLTCKIPPHPLAMKMGAVVDMIRQLIKQMVHLKRSPDIGKLLLRMEQANNGDGNNKVHHFEFIEKVKIPHDSAWAKLITHIGAKAAMEMCRAITDVQGPLTARLLMMVHDITHGSRVTFVQGPPGTGKTTTNIYLAKIHTLCQYDEANPSKIIYATLAIQNAPLVQATKDIVRMADGERTAHLNEVGRLKASSNTDHTAVDVTEAVAANNRTVLYTTEGKFLQTYNKPQHHHASHNTADENQMATSTATAAIGNSPGQKAYHTLMGDPKQCQGAHQSRIQQRWGAAFRQTRGGINCAAVRYLALQELVREIEAKVAKQLRNVIEGASSQDRKDTARELFKTWELVGADDLEVAEENANTSTRCPETQDTRKYLPRNQPEPTQGEAEHARRTRRKTTHISKEQLQDDWPQYIRMLMTGEAIEPPKTVTDRQYLQARSLTIMTVLCKVAEAQLMKDATVAEAFGLTQQVIMGVTYDRSRRLPGHNIETQERQTDEIRDEVKGRQQVPCHTWHGAMAGEVGNANYAMEVFQPDGTVFPTEAAMEDRQEKAMMPREPGEANRCDFIPPTCQAWVTNNSLDQRCGIPMNSPKLYNSNMYREPMPRPPGHGFIIVPQTNRHSEEGTNTWWQMMKRIIPYFLVRNGGEISSEEQMLFSIGHVTTKESIERRQFHQAISMNTKGTIDAIMTNITKQTWPLMSLLEKETYLIDNPDALLTVIKLCARLKQDASITGEDARLHINAAQVNTPFMQEPRKFNVTRTRAPQNFLVMPLAARDYALNSIQLHATIWAYKGLCWAVGTVKATHHAMHEFMTMPLPALIWLHPKLTDEDMKSSPSNINAHRKKMMHLAPYVQQFYEEVLIHFLPSELANNMPTKSGIDVMNHHDYTNFLYGRTRTQMGVEENGEITKEHLRKSVSPLTFLVLNMESEAQQTNQWQGVYFLTLKDKLWPWGQPQKDNEIHEPMIGMGAVRLNNKLTKGTMNVDSYFKFEKSGSHLQFNACYKKGQQEVNAGSTTMLTHRTWLEWHQSHSDKINRCEPGHLLEQMEQGSIGITIQLMDMNGIVTKHAIIPATHELMTRYCPETVGIYQYHVGLTDAPTEIHEELEVSPEEDEKEETEKPYQNFGHRIMSAIQEIHRTRRGQLTKQTDYMQLMLQSSRLPTVMRPVVFTFEVDKLEKLADSLFKIMVYDQCTKIEDFAERGKVDQIGTHIWLNAICVPIARTLTWLLADVVTDAEDAYQIKVTDANGDDKHAWKGFNTARAGEVAYWVNQLDQTILHKEAIFNRINNDPEAIDREHRRVANSTPGTHTTTTWTWGGVARAARSKVNPDTKAEKRIMKPLHVSPHEISVKIPIAHAQAAIVKLQMLAPMIQDRRLTLWTNAEENIGANQKSRHRETGEEEQYQTRAAEGDNKLKRTVITGTESCYQLDIDPSEIVEQTGLINAFQKLRKMRGDEWQQGVPFAYKKEKDTNDAHGTPQARVIRIPKKVSTLLTVTIPNEAHRAMNESVHTDVDKWPMKVNRTPISTQYDQIGSQAQTQPVHLYTHLTTTLLYAGAHPGKKGYYQNLAVERQFMRREGYPANLGTPKVPLKNGVVVVDRHIDTIPDKAMEKAREVMRSLAREEATTGKDYGRHIHTQSTKTNGNVIVRTEREEAHNGKRITRRTLKQAYTPTITRPTPTEAQQKASKARIWPDPYVMPLNADAMRVIHED